MFKRIFFLIFLTYLVSSKLTHIPLHKKESKSKFLERNFFYTQFAKSGSFSKFITNNKHKKAFLKKHFTTIKKYFSDYKRKIARLNNMKSVLAGSGVQDPITSASNDFWYGPFALGTPQQDFVGMYDTGSADCLVSSSLGKPSSQFDYPTYDHNASSTYVPINGNFTIEYGSGAIVSGFTSGDIVSIQDLSASGFIFAEINQADNIQMFGLGFQAISQAHTVPAIQLFYQQGKISEASMGLYINRDVPEGLLTIGGLDSTKFIGNIIYYKLVQASYWIFDFNGFVINNQTIAPNKYAIIDSGTTLIATPATTQLAAIVGNINSNCADVNYDLPMMYVWIGEDQFPLTPQQYVYSSGNQCIFGFEDYDFGFDILGDTFITVYYVVFDYTNERIGFARSISP